VFISSASVLFISLFYVILFLCQDTTSRREKRKPTTTTKKKKNLLKCVYLVKTVNEICKKRRTEHNGRDGFKGKERKKGGVEGETRGIGWLAVGQ
jgi:hypothetical protein